MVSRSTPKQHQRNSRNKSLPPPHKSQSPRCGTQLLASELKMQEKRNTDLLPRCKGQGVDMCGDSFLRQYIIRSDLGCYMLSTDVSQGFGLTVYELHPSCQGGDHYLVTDEKYFVIKGGQFRCGSDLSKDFDAGVYDLHPMCQGGDHYLYVLRRFYIIYQCRGVIHETSDLTTDIDGTDYVLNPKYKDGLYFWSAGGTFFVMKPKDEWGVQYHSAAKLNEDIAGTFSVHHDVLNFLPGGMALTHGPAFGKWEIIKTLDNDSKTPVTWQEKIKRKVGYTKSKSSSMEHNWNMSLSASYQTGILTEAIAKFQFSISAQYGGAHINTENQSWQEVTEVEEKLNQTLNPNEKVYVWQFKLGFGTEDVLFCRDIKFTNNPNPPTDVI